MNDAEKYEYTMLDEDFESMYEEEDLSWFDQKQQINNPQKLSISLWTIYFKDNAVNIVSQIAKILCI